MWPSLVCVVVYGGWRCAHPPGSQRRGPCCSVASRPSRRLARWSRWARSSRLSFVRFVPLAFAVRARLVARPLASSSASAPRPRFSRARAIASGPISIRRASPTTTHRQHQHPPTARATCARTVPLTPHSRDIADATVTRKYSKFAKCDEGRTEEGRTWTEVPFTWVMPHGAPAGARHGRWRARTEILYSDNSAQ